MLALFIFGRVSWDLFGSVGFRATRICHNVRVPLELDLQIFFEAVYILYSCYDLNFAFNSDSEVIIWIVYSYYKEYKSMICYSLSLYNIYILHN